METMANKKKMQSYRLKPSTIDDLNRICEEIEGKINVPVSRGEVIDALVRHANIKELTKYFKIFK